jgi:hypothetical protein
MTLDEISNIRVISQKIASADLNTANEIAAWMGAIQAQDYSMAKWAIGVRLSDAKDKIIEESFNKGEIIRTHLMRPTWHFVSDEDIYWMLELTAPHIKSSLRSRHKQLELSGSVIKKSNSIIEKSLSGGLTCTREELGKEFIKARIKTDDNRLSHLLLLAELDGIICSGPIQNGKHTYSLLPYRVQRKNVLTRDESLAELAKRYFTSHCPATIQDFAWWSGLSRKDALRAVESVKQIFITETVDSGKYFLPDRFQADGHKQTSVYLLPAYDEFLISYRDRSASLSLTDNKKTVSVNGIFYPVIVVNGQVTGLWKRSVKNNRAIIELNLFHKPAKAIRDLIEIKATIAGKFFTEDTEVRYTE